MNINFSKTAVLFLCTAATIGYSQEKKEKKKTAKIDLSHWTVTVPVEDLSKPGKPVQLEYPEILDSKLFLFLV